MYQYLTGLLIFGLPIWLLLFSQKNYRKAMLRTGLTYSVILIIGFIVVSLKQPPESLTITPGYWHPQTLFDLTRKTGGLGIEDILFMFIASGIATAGLEFIFNKKFNYIHKSKRHYSVIIFGIILTIIFYKMTHLNMMYNLIMFNIFCAIDLWIDRRDLIKHSLLGGIMFGFVYLFLWFGFLQIYPGFVIDNYNLKNLLNIFIFGIPIEEILYGFSFGLFWSPEIEYETGVSSK